MAKISIPYSGNEIWAIPNNAQPNELQTYLQNFQSRATRAAALNQSDYSNGAGAKKDVLVFFSRDTIKDLMGGVVGTTPRVGVVGICLRFGFDTVGSKVVLIAYSANGTTARPTGPEYANFNYLSNTVTASLPNPAVSDTEVDVFTANFRSNGHTFLSNLAEGAAISVKFDKHIMARLLYADIGPVPTISGQSAFHLVIAPPWEGEAGQYLSVVGQGQNAANATIYRGGPPCPPYCI